MNKFKTKGFFTSDESLIFSTTAQTNRQQEFIRDMHEHIQKLSKESGLKCVLENRRTFDMVGEYTTMEININ